MSTGRVSSRKGRQAQVLLYSNGAPASPDWEVPCCEPMSRQACPNPCEDPDAHDDLEALQWAVIKVLAQRRLDPDSPYALVPNNLLENLADAVEWWRLRMDD